MADLLETDDRARQLMERLNDPEMARLDANELAASLRAELLARFRERLDERRRQGPPPYPDS
jgi:hypothetical protein